LHSEPAAYIQGVESWTEATNITRQQYAAIMGDIEQMIEDQRVYALSLQMKIRFGLNIYSGQ
jgi:hypothetical protein